jgi:uncharacterized RDD family membrane protein YckC
MRTVRLLALAALGGAIFCPRPGLAQAPQANPDNHKPGIHRDLWISFGKDVELRSEDSANEVVVIGGSAIIHGAVDQDVEVIGGDVEIDGHVGGQVLALFGDAQAGPKAEIGGQLVCVGGDCHVAQGAQVAGKIVEIGAGIGPVKFLRLAWLRDWFSQCVMELRPLAPGVPWVWWFAGFFFILYLLIAVLFPHPVQCCAAQISARPATTFAAGVLAKLSIPIVCLILPLTLVGIVLVPFLIVAAFLTLLVGKAAVLQHVGGKIGGLFGLSAGQRPLAAFFIGSVLITLLYVVPVIGLLALCFFGCWAMGAGVTAICVAMRSIRPPPPPAPAAAPLPPTPSAPLAPPLTPPQALAYPRAGFWERMGAGFLDMVLISLLVAWAGPLFFLAAIAYFSGLWAWKGTTLGGIVLNLQVVRQDGQPVNFLTAFVRSLAALFSAMVFFLGFFWIGWDRDKQGWHDKIAGTVVIRLPRAVSLVCF